MFTQNVLAGTTVAVKCVIPQEEESTRWHDPVFSNSGSNWCGTQGSCMSVPQQGANAQNQRWSPLTALCGGFLAQNTASDAQAPAEAPMPSGPVISQRSSTILQSSMSRQTSSNMTSTSQASPMNQRSSRELPFSPNQSMDEINLNARPTYSQLVRAHSTPRAGSPAMVLRHSGVVRGRSVPDKRRGGSGASRARARSSSSVSRVSSYAFVHTLP